VSPKYWELIADKIKASGWSVGWIRYAQGNGLIWQVDAIKDGQRHIVQAEEITVAFLTLESAVCGNLPESEDKIGE